tara:strand:- start:1445 stop:2224 length:780 start_codon:yes stop_codon:yes gene_type:complete
MSAYKYYPALQLTSGVQTLPSSLRLHNDNAVAVTLTITPAVPNSVFNPFSENKDIVSSLVGLTTGRFNGSGNINETTDIIGGDGNATITIVATAGDIVSATIDDEGNNFRAGMTVSTIVDDVNATGINKGVGTMTVAGVPVESGYFVYTPVASNLGTGFKVGFSISAAGALENIQIINEGSGYVNIEQLLFTENGQDFLLVIATSNLGVNVTLNFLLVGSDIANNTFPFKLNEGESTEFLCKAVTMGGTDDRSLLAFLI